MSQIPRIYRFTSRGAFLLFVALDVLCVGFGMGVPIFNIAFGFVVGWYLVKWMSVDTQDWRDILRRLLIYSCITASVTSVGMMLLWGWSVALLFDPQADIAHFGIPLILFEPRVSLVGWLLLMILVSPVLQMLATVFSGNVTLLSLWRRPGSNR